MGICTSEMFFKAILYSYMIEISTTLQVTPQDTLQVTTQVATLVTTQDKVKKAAYKKYLNFVLKLKVKKRLQSIFN